LATMSIPNPQQLLEIIKTVSARGEVNNDRNQN
jgi:hypothetical protein